MDYLCTHGDFGVSSSVMPKGVEHKKSGVESPGDSECVEFSDAERR